MAHLKGAVRALGGGFLALMMSAPVAAGDHQDGSRVQDEVAGDITGLWAFMPDRGEQPAPLVVAMGIRPFALGRQAVGGDYDYSFRIRPAALGGSGSAVHSRTGGEELRVTCRFNRAREVVCDTLRFGGSGTATPQGGMAGDFGSTLWTLDRRVRAFADIRKDPYMVNVKALHECMDTGEIAFLTGDTKFLNSFAVSNVNTVGLVVEIHPDLLPRAPGLPLLAVAAESVLVGEGGEQRIDRAGRPETTVFLIQDDDRRNGWNARDPFSPNGLDLYRDEMQRGLTGVDSLSRKGYWNYPHPLLGLMLNDYLLVNPTVSVDPLDPAANHFMSLEWAAYQGQSLSRVAGGRRFTDNSVDRFFSIFARQGRSGFKHLETLRQPLYRPTHAEFPYMSAAIDRVEHVYISLAQRMFPMNGKMRGCQ